MAKDFTNTQTGGEGATAQVGDKPTKSAEIKKPQGRPSTPQGGDNAPTEGVKPTKEKSPEPADSTGQSKSVEPPVPLESEGAVVDAGVDEEVPLVAPLTDNPIQDQVRSYEFAIPSHEQGDDLQRKKSNASFGVPGHDDVTLPVGKPENPVEDEPDKVYGYPGRNKQYKIVDGYWQEKSEGPSEWRRSSRGTAFALNDYHSRNSGLSKKAQIPERTYFPQKGGADFEGIKVYGNPYQEGTAYTIQNNRWYKVDQGNTEWEPVDSDRTINALNKYHGTEVETLAQSRSRAAVSKPGTAGADLAGTTGGLQRQIEEAGEMAPPRPISNIEQIGEILQSRGMELGESRAEAATDETGYANKMYSTGVDVMFGTPPRPSRENYNDEISYNMAAYEWDKKYALPATTEGVDSAEKARQTIIEDRDNELSRLVASGYDENSSQYLAAVSDFDALIVDADKKVEDAKAGFDIQTKGFQNRSAYMQSEQYEIDKKNSPYNKIAEIQNKLNKMSYGMYDATGFENYQDEASKAYVETTFLNDQVERSKLENFVQQDISATYKDYMTDSQVAQLVMAQERMKDVLDKGAMPGVAEKMVQETYAFVETTKEINNRLAEAHNRGMELTDVLLENKKVLLENNREAIGEETAVLFEETLKMRDFVSDYIESGKITIDPDSGVYSVSDNVSQAEREYIDGQLSELIDNYKVAKNEIYSNNRKVISEKSKLKKSFEAAIAMAEKGVKIGTIESTLELNERVQEYKNKVRELGLEIKDLKTGENTFFMNDPNAIVLDVSGNATISARQLYQAIPDGISPKDRFDIFYESLQSKNEALKKKYSISQSYLDRAGEKARDILDWEYLGVKLSPQEIEYYKNAATIRQLAPLYLNNDWGVTEESAGFWSAFDNALTGTIAPNTSAAYGFFNETDAAATMSRVVGQLGISEQELAAGMSLDRLNERIDVDFLSTENAGSMLGTTSAIMMALAGSGYTVSGGTGIAKNFVRLLDKYKDFDKISDAAKDFQRVERAFKSTMGETRLGRFFYETGKQGVDFQVAGMIFNQDDELNFMSGMGGAMAGKMFEGVFSKMKPSQVVEWVGSMFGANTDKAVAVFKRLGESKLKQMHYRGLGEMPEEFAQELIGIYRDELDGRGFWNTVNERYFKGEEGLSNLGELLVSSYILGAGMGIGTNSIQNDIWNDLPPNEKAIAERIIQDALKDFTIGNANADIAAERIVNNYEAAIDAVTNPDRKKPTIKVEKEEDTAKAESDEEVSTEGVEPEVEKATADTLDQAKELYEQGYRPVDGDRVNESATLAEIENTWIKGRSVDMVKPVVEAEVEAEAEIEPETKAKIIPLSERIRGLKMKDTEFEAEAKATTSEEASNLWEQGYVPMVNGEAQYGLTQDEVSQMAAEGEIDMVKPRPVAASILPKPVINAAIDVVAKGVEAVEKFIADIKQQQWYEDLKNNPKKLAKADAELEQLRADAQNLQARKDAPSLEEHSENITARMSEAENESFNNTLLKGTNAAKRKGYSPDAEPMLIETDGGVTAVYETADGVFGVRVNRKKDGSLGKTATVLDSDAVGKEMNEAQRQLTPKRVKPTEAVKTIKERIAQFKAGYKKGVAEAKKLTAEEKKARQEEINEVQEQLVDYARETLPKKGYTQAEVTAAMNKIRNAKTPAKLEEALDWIDNKADEFKESLRQESIDRIESTFADPLTKKRGDKKVSRISKDSREKLGALAKEVGIENIQNMTQEQLNELETRMDAIISGGKAEVKAKEEAVKEERMTERNVPFEVLTKQNKAQAIDAKSGQKIYRENTSTIKRATRKLITDPIQAAGRTLESRMMDIYRGSKQLREWAKKNILDATNKAYRDRDNGRAERQSIIEEKLAEIFPKGFMGMPRRLRKQSSVKIGSTKTKLNGENEVYNWFRGKKGAFTYDNKLFTSKSAFDAHLKKTGKTYESIGEISVTPEGQVDLINDQVVRIYNMAKVDAKPIYQVGDQLFDSQKKADEYAKAAQEKTTLTSEYNPNVLRQISEDGSLEAGLKKIADVNNAVESDEALKAWADFELNDFYSSAKDRYEPKFEEIYDMGMKEGLYVPMTRSVEPEMETDATALLGNNKQSASSAMSNHLKQRYNDGSAKFDFSKGSLQTMYEYTNSMEHAMAFLPVAESMRNLMNETVKPQVIAKIGKSRTTQLQNQMNDIISDGNNLVGTEKESYAALDAYLKWKVVTTLALKTASIPKQFTSATHWFGAGIKDGVGPMKVGMELVRLTDGIAELSDQELEVIKGVWKDAFTQNRMSGKDIDFEVRKLHRAMENNDWENVRDIATRIGMIPTVAGDMGGVLIGGVPYTMAQYRHNVTNKGMNHKEAMEDALYKYVQVANDTQQSTRRDILSNVQTSTAMRMFFTFKTSQIAAMSRLIRGAKVLSDTKGEYSSEEKGQAAYDMTYYAVAQALFVAVANGTVGMMFGEDDDDDKRSEERKKTAIYNLIMDTVSSNAQGLGIPGMVGDFVLNNLRNREAFNNIPVLDMIEDFTSAESSLIRVLVDGGDPTKDVSESEYKNFVNVLGLKNIMKSWKSLNQWKEGDIDAWDAIMNRTMEEDPETGERHKYHTGEEREDWLYQKWVDMIYGEDMPEPVDTFRSDVEEEIQDRLDFYDRAAEPEDRVGEAFVERAGSGISTEEFTTELDPIERKYRTKEEIENRKKSEASREEPILGGGIAQTEDVVDTSLRSEYKTDEEIRAEKTAKWAEKYRNMFGEEPPKDMPSSKIMDAVVSGKKE